MYESGQPLHAFGYDSLRGSKIIVKNALDGEKFTTLTGQNAHFLSSTLMICDGENEPSRSQALWEGQSEISESTTSVLIGERLL